MKHRILSLYVENDIGVLAKISGLFSGKCYNLESLTVGETEDETISRMTICLNSDNATFEQIIKQLNSMVEVIKVKDFTHSRIYRKELLMVKVKNCTEKDKSELFRIATVFKSTVVDYGLKDMVIESVQTSQENSRLIELLSKRFLNIEVVRGGDMAIESV